MSTQPKAYSAEEKVAIIQKGIASNVTQTCRKVHYQPNDVLSMA
jgi:hypothetical protein